jgi:transcriptional regulator with XRE-family HTH domain
MGTRSPSSKPGPQPKKKPAARPRLDPHSVSERLRQVMNQSGLNSRQIALRAGLDPNVVQRFRMRERPNIRIATVDRLARALGLFLIRADDQVGAERPPPAGSSP